MNRCKLVNPREVTIGRMRVKELRRALTAAIEAIWQSEIIETDMVNHEIGPNGNYADKADWIDSKLIELLGAK